MKEDPGLASWLQLTLTPGLSAAALRGMLRRFGLPEAILSLRRAELAAYASPAAIQAIDSDSVKAAVSAALEWLRDPRHFAITLADDRYPRALLEITDPPAVLYVAGRPELLQSPSLAVVGSRNASAQGEANAANFARVFSETGLTIVSGLALGIDAAAHRGGLGGPGSTVAVLGTGIDVIYPRRNAELAREIVEKGALVSEFPLGTPPAAYNFPRRNRLISGLSRVAELSGLHASASNSVARGPRNESAEAADAGLLVHMGHDPVDVDSLCSLAGLSPEHVSGELLRLELDGQVTALPGGLYQRLVAGAAGKR
jgi:DNA processing protein